jgi:hypothetical protein
MFQGFVTLEGFLTLQGFVTLSASASAPLQFVLGTKPAVSWITSQADKGLDHLAEDTVQTKFSRHGNQANAFFIAADNRLVIDVIIAKVEVTDSIKPSFMGEASGKYTRHFNAGMGVL